MALKHLNTASPTVCQQPRSSSSNNSSSSCWIKVNGLYNKYFFIYINTDLIEPQLLIMLRIRTVLILNLFQHVSSFCTEAARMDKHSSVVFVFTLDQNRNSGSSGMLLVCCWLALWGRCRAAALEMKKQKLRRNKMKDFWSRWWKRKNLKMKIFSVRSHIFTPNVYFIYVNTTRRLFNK